MTRPPSPSRVRVAAALAAVATSALSAAAYGCSGASNSTPAGGAPAAGPTPFVDGGAPTTTPSADGSVSQPAAWRFVVVGDTHVTESGAPIASEMVPFIVRDAPSLVLVAGDIVQAGKACTTAQMEAQLRAFQSVLGPLYEKGIGVFPVRGNHEADAIGSANAWASVFRGTEALPSNGPSGEVGFSYSVTYKNALFVAADEYVTLHRVNQPWLDGLLAQNTLPHVFVFGHEPAFKNFHTDCLGSLPAERNAFWSSLQKGGAKVYLTAHDHFRDLTRIDDRDGRADNDLFQYTVGTGGGPFPPTAGGFTGDNGPFTPVNVTHAVENGYLLVEVSGDGAGDRDVTMTFKRRACDDAGACTYPAAADVFRYTAGGAR